MEKRIKPVTENRMDELYLSAEHDNETSITPIRPMVEFMKEALNLKGIRYEIRRSVNLYKEGRIYSQ